MLRSLFISIPLGSIKRHLSKSIAVSCRISIPLGSIKRLNRGDEQVTMSIFQFHLVRLKASPHVQEPFVSRISIPLGSIKSPIFYEFNAEFVISIPLGSIKSFYSCSSHSYKRRFQFHLVRLKAHSVNAYTERKSISIPLGSIKRTARQAPSHDRQHFNSTWFD